MSRIVYNKLVRDRIPEIITAQGKPHEVAVVSEADYRALLFDKLQEEAAELATGDNLAEELADIYEVLDAIIAANGLSADEIATVKAQKREKRGGFTKRIKLLWVDDPD
ncbi:MAG: nucleotide pyrophosphohydrolase [Anaerolineaceae bacterium]|nr:nucleotide pyrophosphohydrolase [Anaerolineaceae bacterium]